MWLNRLDLLQGLGNKCPYAGCGDVASLGDWPQNEPESNSGPHRGQPRYNCQSVCQRAPRQARGKLFCSQSAYRFSLPRYHFNLYFIIDKHNNTVAEDCQYCTSTLQFLHYQRRNLIFTKIFFRILGKRFNSYSYSFSIYGHLFCKFHSH